MAISNLVLSVVLVRWYGLIGVAIGTLIPMVVFPLFVVFPAACRRVELSKWTVIRESVWPAVWPALVMAGFILFARSIRDASWSWMMVQAVLAAGVYAALFLLFAISRNERDWYFNKVKEVFRRRSATGTPANELSQPS
jgi:O-antigen/teichoic acid export membrane protein